MKVVLIIYALSVLFAISSSLMFQLKCKSYIQKYNIVKCDKRTKYEKKLGNFKLFLVHILPVINIIYGCVAIFDNSIANEVFEKTFKEKTEKDLF